MAKLPRLPGSDLTPSQALFSKLTELDARCLRIERGDEFYVFMDLRAELQWASFKMNAFKWVQATEEYNKRLTKANRKAQRPTIKKNPRALIEKLVDIEQKILSRIARRDYRCTSPSCSRKWHVFSLIPLIVAHTSGAGDSSFWLKHCMAVPLGRDMNEVQQAGRKYVRFCCFIHHSLF